MRHADEPPAPMPSDKARTRRSRRVARRCRSLCGPLALAALIATPHGPLGAQTIDDLQAMSLSELADVDVSSVSKTAESLSDAPAAIYVIGHDAIVRSGANTIPELLRLAPNLQVAQTRTTEYVIAARGLSGNEQAQNFTNKLLVLIDGRSVYTPLFSGVYWDMQDVLPADIDRIEVISGPGATLWGANAVNGVINIITRRSGTTQGVAVQAEAGARARTASLRYGGRLGENVAFRLYGRALDEDQTQTADRLPANDAWSRLQGGFRLDWTPAATDLFTVQGDILRGSEDQLGAGDEKIRGQNLLARWTRTTSDTSVSQVQVYYDRAERETVGGVRFAIDTYDLDLQHSLAPAPGNALVLGGGFRANRFRIVGSGGLDFVPPRRTLTLANIFAQDSQELGRRTRLVLGLKLEDDPYVGVSLLPSARLSFKPSEAVLLWVAASRAIRAPTPFDVDVVESIGGGPFLIGDKDFRTEKLTAFEAGTRIQAGSRASLSISTYYNLHDDLRSIEPAPGGFIPLRWGNGLRGRSYGLEAWGDVQVAEWWRLGAGINLLRERFRFKPGASGILGVAQLGSDPRHQAVVRSSINLGADILIDADLRYVGQRPAPRVKPYVELGGRIGWRVADRFQLYVSGLNLLHEWHQEFPAPANRVPRKVLAGVQWRI